MIAVPGRRQVGKSTLEERFCELAGVPSVFFAATRARAADLELAGFATAASAALDAPHLATIYPGWDRRRVPSPRSRRPTDR